jgi:hypothetical protein
MYLMSKIIDMLPEYQRAEGDKRIVSCQSYRMGMPVSTGRLLELPLALKAVALVQRRLGVEVQE